MSELSVEVEPTMPDESEVAEEAPIETPEAVAEATPEVAPTPTVESAETVETLAEATSSEPELYDLPDGRKVTGQELHKEFKDNLLPDYTRKSQELAEYKRTEQNINQGQEVPAEAWQPQSYEEIVARTKQEMRSEAEQEAQAQKQQADQIEQQVQSDLSELKKSDPALNADVLYSHAVKYGFQDLKAAYANMRDMNKVVQATKKNTAEAVAKREANPVATAPGAAKVDAGLPNPRNYDSAVEYFNAINSK